MSDLRKIPNGMNAITKTAYVDTTDMMAYIDRILPTDKKDNTITAINIAEECLTLIMGKAYDVENTRQRLTMLLGPHYAAVSNMMQGRVNIVFGQMSTYQFESISDAISCTLVEHGIIFTFPVTEWME